LRDALIRECQGETDKVGLKVYMVAQSRLHEESKATTLLQVYLPHKICCA